MSTRKSAVWGTASRKWNIVVCTSSKLDQMRQSCRRKRFWYFRVFDLEVWSWSWPKCSGTMKNRRGTFWFLKTWNKSDSLRQFFYSQKRFQRYLREFRVLWRFNWGRKYNRAIDGPSRNIFVALSYARARLTNRRRVRPSVRPSHIKTNDRVVFTIGRMDSSFWDQLSYPRRIPERGLQIRLWETAKNVDFWPKDRYMSERTEYKHLML